MKDVVIEVWCDMHPDGERIEAEEIPVAIAGKHGTLDLCKDHMADLMAFREHVFLDDKRKAAPKASAPKRGRPSQAELALAKATGEAQECPRCGAVVKTHKNLGVHVRQVHGVTLETLFPELRCNECGQKFDKSQGLAMHLRTQHALGIADYVERWPADA